MSNNKSTFDASVEGKQDIVMYKIPVIFDVSYAGNLTIPIVDKITLEVLEMAKQTDLLTMIK